MNDEQLTQRMREASEALQMLEASQARHLEAVSAALTTIGTSTEAEVVSLTATGASRRRRMVASVVAAAVIAPVGLAAASEGSVPGDALYPVKQISERVLVMFDSDVIAQHRIEEIEALESAGRFDSDLFEDARAALSELGADHPLWQRLASVTSGNDAGSVPSIDEDDDDDRSELDSTDVVVIAVELPDGSEATVTLSDDDLVGIELPTGWMVSETGDDGATLENDEYIVEIEVSDGTVELEVTQRGERESEDDDSADGTATTSSSHDDRSGT